MCYCHCVYEDYYGECQKPRYLPCPENEADVDAWERAQEDRYEQAADDRLRQEMEAE